MKACADRRSPPVGQPNSMAKGKTLRLSTSEKSRRLRAAAYERRRDGAPPPVPRRSPCFGPCIVCNQYPKPGTKLKSAKDRLCKSCYNLKLREAKPKAKPKAEALNVELRRLRDRQRRQGIYPTGAQPLPRLTRAQSKAYEKRKAPGCGPSSSAPLGWGFWGDPHVLRVF